MGKSQKNNKKEYRVLNGSLDLIEYYQIFGCDRHKYQTKETITRCLGCFRQKYDKTKANSVKRQKYDKTKLNSVKRLKVTVFINN
jgi:hypothetical protein